MNTILVCDDQKTFEISDEGFEASGWITIRMGKEEREVHIKDLMPAIIGFDAKYSRSKEES